MDRSRANFALVVILHLPHTLLKLHLFPSDQTVTKLEHVKNCTMYIGSLFLRQLRGATEKF